MFDCIYAETIMSGTFSCFVRAFRTDVPFIKYGKCVASASHSEMKS